VTDVHEHPDEENHDHDEESAEEPRVAERLDRERPTPAAAFRGALGRYLAARDPGYGPRPENLRLLVGGALISGAILIALGLVQALGGL
jgi:hypothetical protein